MQYWQIFFSFLLVCYYFTRLKAPKINCKIWETRKIFPILHLAPYDNSNILHPSTENFNLDKVWNSTIYLISDVVAKYIIMIIVIIIIIIIIILAWNRWNWFCYFTFPKVLRNQIWIGLKIYQICFLRETIVFFLLLFVVFSFFYDFKNGEFINVMHLEDTHWRLLTI